MQRPPTWSAASSTTKRLPAAASRRPAAMPAAPAPTTTASTQPERGTSGVAVGRGAASAGAAARAAAEEARNDRRLKRLMAHGVQALRGLPRNACGARPKSFPIVTMLAVSPQQCLIQTRRPRSRNQGRETTMIDAAVKALVQMCSPPFRSVLLKSAGLALALIVLIAIALQRLLVWLTTAAADWAETVFGISAHAPLSIFIWVVSIAAGLGIIVGSVFLMPAVTALVGSFFVDDIAL